MRRAIALSTVLPGWTRLWLSLTALLSPLSITAAIIGDWDADTNRITVATAFLSLTALAFFLLALALRLHLALLAWIIAGFDLPTRRTIRRQIWPLVKTVLTLLVLGFCLFWLRNTSCSPDPTTGRDSFVPTVTISI
jgi:hypothetical protein